MPKTRSVWKSAVEASAEPVRVARWGQQMAELRPDFFRAISPEQARVLASLAAGSRALAELLLAKPAWLEVLEADALKNPRRRDGLRREVAAFLDPALAARDTAGAQRPLCQLSPLREFKQREMLRIAGRDLARFGPMTEITEEISHVADACLSAVCALSLAQLQNRFGLPCQRESPAGKWTPATFCVLGMGKLGGQELNYSSDIDVLFVYSNEGDVFRAIPSKSKPGKRTIQNHQFYARLAESIIAECTRMTAEGFLFRIDLRLRPEGKTAPLARSLGSYENYYAQSGQTWERMMLIKARGVAGDGSLAAEFLEMIQPFRYPRAISEQIPREVAQMKARIENEVIRAGELERNVKLGRGGIREIEFLAQTLQVLNGGRLPFLQGPKTLPALDKLSQYGLLEPAVVSALRNAYVFLRDVEHRLQMEDNRQTHTLPAEPEACARIARLMGLGSLAEFNRVLRSHCDGVRAVYDRFINPAAAGDPASALPADVEANQAEWRQLLAEHSFREPERCLSLVRDFIQSSGFGHRSNRTIQHALSLFAHFLEKCPRQGAPAPGEQFLSDPDRVLARLDAFVARYGARAMLYDAWMSNRSLFDLLLLTFDRSEFLAELAIREPDLIDEIELSGQLRRRKTTAQILEDLSHESGQAGQHRWLRRYYRAEQMRIGLRDILGLADAGQTQVEITALADAFLTHALQVVQARHRLRKPPFAIIGLGKLGGGELIYASDLDILFVADDSGQDLSKLQKIAAELMDLLSVRTEDGTTFETDARLRPDGGKGLLVQTLGACREYYQKRAMLWEIQSLSRFRPIAGHATVSERFSALALQLTHFAKPPALAAYSAGWRGEINRMRLRIEKERTPPGQDALAIKTGRGGLMDAEFVAQAVCLEQGWHEPNTLAALARAGREKALPPGVAETLGTNYRKLMQIERILRRWSFVPESLLPGDPAPFYRVAVRCGFSQAGDFAAAVRADREAMRQAYQQYFS